MSDEKSWRDLREAEERAARAREVGDRQAEGNALIWLALCQQEVGQLGEAIASFEQALSLLHPFRKESDEVLVLRSLGSCLLRSGKMARAFALFDEALPLARRGHDMESEFTCLYQLGIAATALEKTQVAIASFQQALTIIRLLEQKSEEIHTLGGLGAAYMQAGLIQEAIACHEQARTLAQLAGDLDGEAYELANLGSAYACGLGDIDAGITYYEQALGLFRQLGDEGNLAKTLANIGKALVDALEQEKARPYLEQAQALALRIGDRVLLSAILSSLGDIEEDLGDIATAIRDHERAVEVARGRGEQRQEEQSLNALALLWKRSGHPQKAVEIHQDALALAHDRRDPLGAARQLGNIALALDEMGEVGLALAVHKQALLLFQAGGDLVGEGRTLVYMGMSTFRQGSFAQAFAFFRFGQMLLSGMRAWEEEHIAPTIEQLRDSLGESRFRRAWRASEQHIRRLHFQHHWPLLGSTPLKGEIGNSLDPSLCAVGETTFISSLSDLPEWLEARSHVDAKAWKTIFSRFEATQKGGEGEGGTGASRGCGLRALGCAYAEAGYLQEAARSLNRALSWFREQGDRDEAQMTLFTLAHLLLRTERWQEAEARFHEALSCTIEPEDDARLAPRSYRRVGAALRIFDNLGRSRFFLEAALEMARRNGNALEEGCVLSELGRTHSAWGHEQKAIQCHQLALDIFAQDPKRAREKEQRLWLARSYAVAGKFAGAETLLKEMQATAHSCRDVARASMYLGILSLLQQDTDGYLMGLREAMKAIPEAEQQTRECIGRWISQLSLRAGSPPALQRL